MELYFFQARKVLEAEAEAEAIQLRGDAKAFAIEAKAKAEAEQMAKKADAWNEYDKAALLDMMLKTLPKLSSMSSKFRQRLQCCAIWA